MTKETSLREIEKKTYMSYHQDGLLDIFIGAYVLLFGIGIIVNNTLSLDMGFIIPAIFPVVMVPIWIQSKKKITMPRIGFVKLRRTASNRLTAVLLGLMVAGMATFLVFSIGLSQSWVTSLREFLTSYYMILIGISALAFTSLFAGTMGLKRLYGYGILTLVLFVAGHFIASPLEYLTITIGIAVLANGIILLMQFIKKYPLK
jgi:hypothetical protein